jgi:hypothetical protein
MEGDHIKPWHEGGKTNAANCQMLCARTTIEENREVSGPNAPQTIPIDKGDEEEYRRPVFGSDPAVRPVGAVLTHTLKIRYHEGDLRDHREFYVVLDSNDLDELRDIIQRAQTKDKSLRELLKSAQLPTLDD